MDKIGKQGANRLRQEFLDDAKDKFDSAKFDKIWLLMKKYIACEGKGGNSFCTIGI